MQAGGWIVIGFWERCACVAIVHTGELGVQTVPICLSLSLFLSTSSLDTGQNTLPPCVCVVVCFCEVSKCICGERCFVCVHLQRIVWTGKMRMDGIVITEWRYPHSVKLEKAGRKTSHGHSRNRQSGCHGDRWQLRKPSGREVWALPLGTPVCVCLSVCLRAPGVFWGTAFIDFKEAQKVAATLMKLGVLFFSHCEMRSESHLSRDWIRCYLVLTLVLHPMRFTEGSGLNHNWVGLKSSCWRVFAAKLTMTQPISANQSDRYRMKFIYFQCPLLSDLRSPAVKC